MKSKKLLVLTISAMTCLVSLIGCEKKEEPVKPTPSLTGIVSSLKDETKKFKVFDTIKKDDIKVQATYSDETIKELTSNDWTCDKFNEDGTYTFINSSVHNFLIKYQTFESTLTFTVEDTDCVTKTVNMINFPTASSPIEHEVMFFSNNPYVPYITIDDYAKTFNKYPNESQSLQITKNETGKIYTFTNKVNNSTCTLDMESAKLKFPSYSKYRSYNGTVHEEISIKQTVFKNEKIESKSSLTEGIEKTFSLGEYDLAPRYVESKSAYYVPYDLLTRLDPYRYRGTAYYDGKNNVTVIDAENTKYTGNIIKSYPKSFYTFSYGLFTFDVDLIYGLKGYSRPLRSWENYNYTYLPNGAIFGMYKFADLITNAKTTYDFDMALDSAIKGELDDGGHTLTFFCSLATDVSTLPISFGRGKEYLYTSSAVLEEREKRKSASSEQKLNESVCTFDIDGDGKEDTGYMTLGRFANDELKEILQNANIKFNKNKTSTSTIKNVVLDVGCNVGGSVGAEGALLSWLCNGEAKQVLKDSVDGSIATTVYKYDIDGNDSYGPEDYLPADTKIYIISDANFSAGSAIAFDTYMYTKSDDYKNLTGKSIKFIGRPNLGGSCSVTEAIYLPTGYSFRMSSEGVGIDWYDNTKTADQIMPASEGWENMTIENIVDRTGYINPKIKDGK